MAFADAIFDGACELEGVRGRRVDAVAELSDGGADVLLTIAELGDVLAALLPDVLVDARMRKRAQPETQRGFAPLTIGLGPNFVAGVTTDLAIETQWGDELGAIVSDGPTQVLGGEPRSFEQLLAPLDGILRGFVHDGVAVDEGAKVLEVDPRNDLSKVFGIGPRPRRIAEGVLAAIEGKRGGVS